MNLVPAVHNDFEVAVLRLSGRFDTSQEPQVKEWLDIQTSTGLCNLVISLEEVDSIDSTGLATLVQGMQSSREGGGDLLLSGLKASSQAVLASSCLDRSFQICATETEAFNRLLTARFDRPQQ